MRLQDVGTFFLFPSLISRDNLICYFCEETMYNNLFNASAGHTHVAEALKIPIHIFFTMPWT